MRTPGCMHEALTGYPSSDSDFVQDQTTIVKDLSIGFPEDDVLFSTGFYLCL